MKRLIGPLLLIATAGTALGEPLDRGFGPDRERGLPFRTRIRCARARLQESRSRQLSQGQARRRRPTRRWPGPICNIHGHRDPEVDAVFADGSKLISIAASVRARSSCDEAISSFLRPWIASLRSQ